MEINFYLDDDIAEKIFEVKNIFPNRRRLTVNEFVKLIIESYVKRQYQKMKKEGSVYNGDL